MARAVWRRGITVFLLSCKARLLAIGFVAAVLGVVMSGTVGVAAETAPACNFDRTVVVGGETYHLRGCLKRLKPERNSVHLYEKCDSLAGSTEVAVDPNLRLFPFYQGPSFTGNTQVGVWTCYYVTIPGKEHRGWLIGSKSRGTSSDWSEFVEVDKPSPPEIQITGAPGPHPATAPPVPERTDTPSEETPTTDGPGPRTATVTHVPERTGTPSDRPLAAFDRCLRQLSKAPTGRNSGALPGRSKWALVSRHPNLTIRPDLVVDDSVVLTCPANQHNNFFASPEEIVPMLSAYAVRLSLGQLDREVELFEQIEGLGAKPVGTRLLSTNLDEIILPAEEVIGLPAEEVIGGLLRLYLPDSVALTKDTISRAPETRQLADPFRIALIASHHGLTLVDDWAAIDTDWYSRLGDLSVSREIQWIELTSEGFLSPNPQSFGKFSKLSSFASYDPEQERQMRPGNVFKNLARFVADDRAYEFDYIIMLKGNWDASWQGVSELGDALKSIPEETTTGERKTKFDVYSTRMGTLAKGYFYALINHNGYGTYSESTDANRIVLEGESIGSRLAAHAERKYWHNQRVGPRPKGEITEIYVRATDFDKARGNLLTKQDRRRLLRVLDILSCASHVSKLNDSQEKAVRRLIEALKAVGVEVPNPDTLLKDLLSTNFNGLRVPRNAERWQVSLRDIVSGRYRSERHRMQDTDLRALQNRVAKLQPFDDQCGVYFMPDHDVAW